MKNKCITNAKWLSLIGILLIFNQAHAQWKEGDTGTSTTDGQSTAAELTKRYYATQADCGSPARPSFLCNGVMIRSTKVDPNRRYKTWEPSDKSLASNGISFSYLRSDSEFRKLAWGDSSGLIIYPVLKTPAGKIQLEVLCSFPMDAWGWHRTSPCGASPAYPQTSSACQTLGITTAEQWLTHWKLPNVSNPNLNQCGFDVSRNAGPQSANAFTQSLRSMKLLGERFHAEWNELVVKTWGKNIAAQTPIEAFFYLDGGLADAQYNQKDFYAASSGIIVPIIKVTLPAVPASQDAQFTFSSADQVIKGGSSNTGAKCTQYIQSGQWFSRHDPGTGKAEWSLQIMPTDCGRKISADHTEAEYAEMVQKFSNDSQWKNNDRGGMRRQLVCILAIARDKPDWNLEPFRPNVTHEQAVAAGCNPV